jgi:hypothetical protein
MQTVYLKFDSEAKAKEVLAEYITEEGEWQIASHTHAIDLVGIIHKPTGVMLQGEDGEYLEMAQLDGYHINFLGELPEVAQPYIVTPSSPSRVFA